MKTDKKNIKTETVFSKEENSNIFFFNRLFYWLHVCKWNVIWNCESRVAKKIEQSRRHIRLFSIILITIKVLYLCNVSINRILFTVDQIKIPSNVIGNRSSIACTWYLFYRFLKRWAQPRAQLVRVHDEHMCTVFAQVLGHYKFQSNLKWLCRYMFIHLFNFAQQKEIWCSLQVISSVLDMWFCKNSPCLFVWVIVLIESNGSSRSQRIFEPNRTELNWLIKFRCRFVRVICFCGYVFQCHLGCQSNKSTKYRLVSVYTMQRVLYTNDVIELTKYDQRK